jgi:PAS domain S-box-containing protein
MPDSSSSARPFLFRSQLFSKLAAVFVMLVGALALAGWIFDITDLKSVYGQITMKANTAVTLILAGVALFCFTRKERPFRILGQISAGLIALVGLLTLSEHVIGWNLHIDELLFHEGPGALATASPGRMGLTSSTCFLFFGVSLLLLRRRKAVSVAQGLTLIGGLWALLALVGYTYEAEALYAIARYTGIALHTAMALFVLSLGILAACIDEGLLSIVCDTSAAGRMARRLMLVGVLAPFLLGWLRLVGQRAGFFGLGLGTSLLVTAIIIIFLLSVWAAADRLRYAEHQRLRAESNVKEGEERLIRQAALIELSHEPIFVWNFKGPIVDWNRGSERLYGFDKAEAVGRLSHDLLRTQFPTSIEDFYANLERDRHWSGELVHITKDGRRAIVESRQQLIESGDQLLVLETNRDMTERISSEEALAQQRELLQVTLSSIGDAVIATDVAGSITFLNTVARAITGWGDEANGRPVEDVFHIINEQTRAGVENPALRAMKQGIIVGLANHTILITKDGKELPIDDSGAPIIDAQGKILGAVLVFRDVRERRKAERTQALLAGIVQSSDDAIVSKSLDGIIRSWNDGAERVFGYSENEAIGKSITIIVPPERLDEEKSILETLRRGERIEHFETERVTKEGKRVPISLTVSPIKNASGEIIGASKIVRDITQRKYIEQERERLLTREQQLRTEAQAASKLKDEFLATVSHELRTPLNAVLGWSTMFRHRQVPPETLKIGIAAIERNARFQAQLIEDLLDVSRIISGKMQLDIRPIEITPIIKSVLESLRPAAEAKHLQLELTVDPLADRLRADEARLQQIIWNLLSNSVKFTDQGGLIQIAITRSDSVTRISVHDNGQGIEQEFLPFVFDRFQQADSSITRKHGGLGLGLAISRHLVELHGGTIEVESAGAGQGATFRVSLPLTGVAITDSTVTNRQQKNSLARGAAGAGVPNLSSFKVLAIDDAEDARELLKAVLEQFGARVMTASSVQEGLKLLSVWRPDVIVCDIGMPEQDGYTFIKEVRKLSPETGRDVPAIALTGYVRVEDRMRALAAGYQMFVSKPVEATELASLIEAVMGLPHGSSD